MKLIVIYMKSLGMTICLPFLFRGASVMCKSSVILTSLAKTVPITIYELASYCKLAVQREGESS